MGGVPAPAPGAGRTAGRCVVTGDELRQVAEDIFDHDTSSEKARLLAYAVLYGWAARLDREASPDQHTEGGPHADPLDQTGVLAIR